jgi:6-pyruvoyltetrahydropterin/6-carboxytetrahydropterin synthase
MKIERRLSFEAAHRNTSSTATERTRRLHGHSYEVTVAVQGDLHHQFGWVRDFADVKAEAQAVIDRIDHRTLNEIPGITDSTSADVERWLSDELKRNVHGFDSCRVRILGATDWTPLVRLGVDTGAILLFGFPAAHFLPHLPNAHKCRRIHGHSFQVEIESLDPTRLCDEVLRLYPMLDHTFLNDIQNLQNPTSEHLAQWLWEKLMPGRSGLRSITVAETCMSRCIYTGD